MKLSPFGFIEQAETFFRDALSLPPRGGGAWSYQRRVNFVDGTGSLEVGLASVGSLSPRAALHARRTGQGKDFGIQGWVDFSDGSGQEIFVLRQLEPTRAQEEIFDLVERVLARIPERDDSFSPPRPEPAPKPSFEPLINAIQSASTDHQPADEVSIATGDVDNYSAKPEDFDSTQAFVDSLLSPDKFDDAPADAPAEGSEPIAEAASESEAAEKPVKKTKKK
jgi:hypothetical protein